MRDKLQCVAAYGLLSMLVTFALAGPATNVAAEGGSVGGDKALKMKLQDISERSVAEKVAILRPMAETLSVASKYSDSSQNMTGLAEQLVVLREFEVIESLAEMLDVDRRIILWRALADGPPAALSFLERGYAKRPHPQFVEMLAAAPVAQAQAELLKVALDRTADAADRFRAARMLTRHSSEKFVKQLEPLRDVHVTFYLTGSLPRGLDLGEEIGKLLDSWITRNESRATTRPASRTVDK